MPKREFDLLDIVISLPSGKVGVVYNYDLSEITGLWRYWIIRPDLESEILYEDEMEDTILDLEGRQAANAAAKVKDSHHRN